MKNHINLWLVMFLAVSLVLPVYSMAQTAPPTLTLESYTTGDRISGAPIKSFYWGTDGNLVVYLNGPFTFSTLATNISVDGTPGTYSGCTASPPASVTATPGANLSFRVFSTTANANLSMVVDPDPGFTKVNGAVPESLPTPPSPSPLTIAWNTTGVPAGPYLAVFQAQVGTQTPSQLVVAINISQQYKLTLTAGANGTVSPAGDSYYEPGTQASISATANPGYYFSGWSGDFSGTTASTTILMNGNKTVTAAFTLTPPTQYTVTLSANPSAGGTVSGAGSYAAGASVTVTATPASGYTFTNWSESTTYPSSSASYNFTITGSRTLTANFSGGGGGGGGGGGCPNGQLLPLNAQNTLSFGAGSQTCYIARFEGSTITSASLLVFGKDSGTNLNFTWTFPDGTSFSGGALGTDIGGIIKVRSLQGSYPNYNHNYIPAGDHILTINSIGNSWVILTMTYN